MKEATLDNQKAPSELVTKKDIATRLVAKTFPHKGHKMFKIDLGHPALLVSEVDPNEYRTYFLFTEGGKRDLVMQKNHLYTMALNKKNAIKKFAQMLSNGYRFTQTTKK